MTQDSVGVCFSKDGVGLTVHNAFGHVFVSSVGLTKGSLGVWNPNASPQHQLCPGDRIDAIEGKAGNAASILKGLEQLTGSVAKVTFVITKPKKPLTIRVKKPIGLQVISHFTHAYLHVKPENAGSMKQFNDAHPDKQVRAGDRLVSVNGVKGEAATLIEIMTKSDEMYLTFLRYPLFDDAMNSLKKLP